MTYNRFLYNSALYNAGRDEAGAIIRSLIQAHTGPHIRAVVGTDGGISFLSDFIITEGSVRKPPTSYNFPDLSAVINAIKAQTADLGASIFGVAYADLPATVFPVDHLPDLPAILSILSSFDLPATITGQLAEADLPATIFIPITNLSARIFGFDGPQLFARIGTHSPANLPASIWSPHDLAATINYPHYFDLPAVIGTHLASNLPGAIYPSNRVPDLRGYVHVTQSGIDDDLAAVLETVFPYDLPGTVTGIGFVGDLTNLPARIGLSELRNLPASIGLEVGVTADLPAQITFVGAKNLPASISMLAVGVKDRFLPAFIQSVNSVNLLATITANTNFHELSAYIRPFPLQADLSAFIRVAETFVTALFTINTLASRDLRATVGRPECEGGSSIYSLLASVSAQHKYDLQASLSSFIASDLNAKINTTTGVYHFDTIDVYYRPQVFRAPAPYFVTDTLDIYYSPFRGQNLAATIFGELSGVNLPASLTAAIPLPRVAPNVSRILGADLSGGEVRNIQEIRLQLEGALFDFLYVNGTDTAFILDSTQRWRINIRSFKPIAANIFGDFAAARVCRLGTVSSFETMDAAVRHCIDAVLGLNDQYDLTASVNVITTPSTNLPARIGIVNIYRDLTAIAGRVYPSDFSASISSSGGYGDLSADITGT